VPLVWPPSLPQEPLIGWVEQWAETRVRTETDSGPAKVRRRFTAGVRQLQLPLALTEAQMATLDTFFDSTTAGGALRFEWQHPRTGATHEFRFLDPPQIQESNPGLYRLTLNLELLP